MIVLRNIEYFEKDFSDNVENKVEKSNKKTKKFLPIAGAAAASAAGGGAGYLIGKQLDKRKYLKDLSNIDEKIKQHRHSHLERFKDIILDQHRHRGELKQNIQNLAKQGWRDPELKKDLSNYDNGVRYRLLRKYDEYKAWGNHLKRSKAALEEETLRRKRGALIGAGVAGTVGLTAAAIHGVNKYRKNKKRKEEENSN